MIRPMLFESNTAEWKKTLREAQTLRAGCSKAEPKIFAAPQTPFPRARDGQNLISWSWSLRSAARGDLLVPRTRVKFGNRAFAVAGPEAWNSLPVDIRSSDTVTAFKCWEHFNCSPLLSHDQHHETDADKKGEGSLGRYGTDRQTDWQTNKGHQNASTLQGRSITQTKP